MAARKVREREQARRLRSQGWALRRIAVELGVSLSSVSIWVRDVPPPACVAEHVPKHECEPPPASVRTRRCSTCRRVLSLTSFNRNGGDRQWWCRDCFREYFRRRGDVHRNQTREARRRRQARGRRFIVDYLSSHPCVDCGERDPVVLEFDHVGEKSADISRLMAHGASIAALRREIPRCEVVCVNCHRRRTAKRANWRRAKRDWSSIPCSRLPRERQNLDFAYSMLLASSCVDCSASDLCILEFDHVSGKRANVTELAGRGCSMARLVQEIERCVVRCGNCHRRRTARDGGHYRTRDA